MSEHRILLKARLILEKGGKVLLMKQTSENGGKYTLPGGTVEDYEFAMKALKRECMEETGIVISIEDLELVHTLHKKKDYMTRIVLYFKATKWHGIPHSKEPKKFQKVEWFPLIDLPDRMSPTVRHVFKKYKSGEVYSEFSKH